MIITPVTSRSKVVRRALLGSCLLWSAAASVVAQTDVGTAGALPPSPAAQVEPAATPAPDEASAMPPAESSPTPAPTATPEPTPTPSPIEAAAADSTAAGVTAENPPKRPEDVPPFRLKIAQRLDELDKYKTPDSPSPGQKAVADVAAALRGTLETAITQLDAFEAAHKAAAELGSPERIAARNEQLEQYRQRTAELRSFDPTTWSQERRAKIREETAEENEKIRTLTETSINQQAARQKALKQFSADEQEAATRLADARQTFTAAQTRATPVPAASPATAPTGEAALDGESLRTVRELETRQLAWQVFLAGLRIEQMSVDKVLLNLESAAADAIIPVLQAYSAALTEFRSSVVRDSAQQLRDEIASKLAAARTPHERAYWQVRQAIAEGRRVFGTQIRGLREELQSLENSDINHEMEWITDRYRRLLERLERSTGDEKTQAYRQLARHIEEYELRREKKAARLDLARRELELMYEQKEAVFDQLKVADQALRAALPNIATPEERAKFDGLMAELASEFRPGLDSTINSTIERKTLIINRLAEIVAQLETFNTQLERTRQELFWAYTLARGPSVVQAWRTAAERFSVEELRADLAVARDDAAQRLAQRDRTTVLFVSALLVIAVIVALVLSSRLWRAAGDHEDKVSAALVENEEGEVHLNDRVRIQVLRMVGMVLPVGMPTTILLLFAWQDRMLTVEMREVVVRLMLVILLATVTRALIKRLFRPGKPRFRIIPCSNVVAGYYRFWLSSLWWLTMPVIPVVMVMHILNIAPETAEALRITFVSLALLVLIIFVRHRHTVVRVVGRAFALRRPLFFGFIVRAYPFMLLTFLALFALEAIGYDALATYVILNLMHTFGAIALASLLSSMLHDFVRRRTAPPAEPDALAGGQAAEPKEYGIDELLQQYESREWGLMLTSLAAVGQWIVWLGALAWCATAWGMTKTTARALFAYELISPPPESGSLPVTVGRVLIGVLVVIAAFKLSGMVVRTLTNKIYPAYGHVNKAAQATINTLLHYTLITVGFYIGLRVMHIELGALAVLLGGLGLGLGLGLQPLLVNFMSGLIIFAERHVKVGDLVMVGTDLGEVTAISMRSTRVRTPDGIDMVIPNTEFVTSKVVNWTLQDSKIRGKLDVGVAYGSDLKKVRQVLLEIARKEPRVLLDPEPVVWFTEFAENSLNLTLAAWYPNAGDRWSAMIDMRYEIDRRFREENIEIPFPQRVFTISPEAELPIRVLRDRSPIWAKGGDGSTHPNGPSGADPNRGEQPQDRTAGRKDT